MQKRPEGFSVVRYRSADFAFRKLTPTDVDCVFELYKRVHQNLDYGFMADRSIDDFVALLDGTQDCVAVGAFVGDSLAGYSLCQLERRDGLDKSMLLRRLGPGWQEIWSGRGTAVDPEFRGQRLMVDLLNARSAQAHQKGVPHSLALVATGNLASLSGFLRADFCVVGLEEDEYCLNFLCYEGSLHKETQAALFRSIDARNVEELACAFAEGWIGIGLGRGKSSGQTMITLEHLQD